MGVTLASSDDRTAIINVATSAMKVTVVRLVIVIIKEFSLRFVVILTLILSRFATTKLGRITRITMII